MNLGLNNFDYSYVAAFTKNNSSWALQ